jgi:NTE family protein
MKGKKIGLALQGGGSYAAFTCGVLQGLFNSDINVISKDDIHSISGTSGGAINAVLLGKAIHEGKEDVTEYVSKLWELNKLEKMLKDKIKLFNLVPQNFISSMIGLGRKLRDFMPLLSAAFVKAAKSTSIAVETIDDIVKFACPGLPEKLDENIFEDKQPFITVAATEAKSAQAHYFTSNRFMIEKYGKLTIAKLNQIMKPLTLQGVYASISHPIIFNSMKIDDNAYWDGYFTSNPPFLYLFREGCDEVILIRLVQLTREDIKEDIKNVTDRIEEIVQNSVINMEIATYFAMREILYNNKLALKRISIELAAKKFSLRHVFHEIRLLKAGSIRDEAYPVEKLVDKLIKIGKKVVESKNGFGSTYKQAKKGLHIISEVDFDTEEVFSVALDYDKLLFEEEK